MIKPGAATIVVVLLAALRAAAQEPDPVAPLLQRIQDRYSASRTARIEFTERYVSKHSGRALAESGTLWLAPPGRMRWEYREPEEKLFLLVGELSWFYVPRDEVVYRSRTRASDARRLPALFLAGKGDLLRDFEARLERSGALTLLRLTPRRAGEDYEYLELEVEPGSGSIRTLRVFDPLANVTVFEFGAESSPVTLPEGAFEFEPPRGVEVVEPGSGESSDEP